MPVFLLHHRVVLENLEIESRESLETTARLPVDSGGAQVHRPSAIKGENEQSERGVSRALGEGSLFLNLLQK